MTQQNWRTAEVNCYSGYKSDQYPRSFVDPVSHTSHTITNIERTWVEQEQTSGQLYKRYIVILESGERFYLRHRWFDDTWQVLLPG